MGVRVGVWGTGWVKDSHFTLPMRRAVSWWMSDEALDGLAQAFGYMPGYFTTPRLPLGTEETAAGLVETYSYLEIVPVPVRRRRRSQANVGHDVR
jgi:hypothetical protein